MRMKEEGAGRIIEVGGKRSWERRNERNQKMGRLRQGIDEGMPDTEKKNKC